MNCISNYLEHHHPSSVSDESLHVSSSDQSLVDVIGSKSMLAIGRNSSG